MTATKVRSSTPTWRTYALLLSLLVLVAAPLLSVLLTAVFGYRDEPAALASLIEPGMLRVVGNTVWLSLLVVLFATLLAAPLALLMSWTSLRRHSWIDVVVMVPFMTPPFAASMAWMDFTRLGGVASMLFGDTVGQFGHDFIYSVWGMALIMACEQFTFLYLILRTALSTLPASTLEMASVVGASPWHRARSIIVPMLVGPYSLGVLIVFIRSAGEFGTPVTLGNAIGYQVLVSSIHQDVTVSPLSFSQAAATSSVLFTLGVLIWGLQQWVSRKDLTSGGRVSRLYTVALQARGKIGAWLVVAGIFMVSVLIPYFSIVLGSMTILRSEPPGLDNLTFDYFGIVLSKSSAQEALTNSAFLGFAGATLAVLLGLAVTLLTLRNPKKTARTTDFLAIAPDTVPGIVMAVGFILLWNAPWLPITPYGTGWVLILGYAGLFLPMVTQNIKTSASAVSPTVLEAASVAGASTWHIFRRVQLPLMLPGIIAGWLLALLIGFRELVMSSLIRPADMQLLSPWIMNVFDQGQRAEAMAMTLIGVLSSTLILVLVTYWQRRRI
ncbi:ABC transporter permease [Yaniella halotolerans]|uniref:ABC transporter permease n=1 Tax=Yaniella halotolerans TaxID=225453 RepID=UPI0003B51A04|nr:iron ABC transporter permease [Yaniella halotolerans]